MRGVGCHAGTGSATHAGSVGGVLREMAEYPNSFEPPAPGAERIETDRYTLCMGAGLDWNTVQRQRFAASEVDEVLAEVRGLLRARGRTSTQWEIGSTAEPAGLAELLLERGVEWDSDPFAVALVLRAPPPAAPAGLEARAVATLQEYVEAVEVQDIAFGTPPEQAAAGRDLLAARFRDRDRVMHAVWLDGRLVSAGSCALTPHGLLLYGGATHPDARGRGAYRALIAARWEAAVAHGTPALLTQGGSMSRPILERVGFRAVGHVQMLIDRFDG